MFAKVMTGESIPNIQATFITKDGRAVHVEGDAAPRFIGDKTVATYCTFRPCPLS